MEHLNGIFTGVEAQDMIITVIGFILTFLTNRALAMFTVATGIKVQQAHQDSLHRAIQTGVESFIKHGPREAGLTMKAHVLQHLRESVPDALKALTPGDSVIDRLIDRYVGGFLNNIGEPK